MAHDSGVKNPPPSGIDQSHVLVTELAQEREKTENVELELERIRQERQRMEELLQNLKAILEGSSISQNSNIPH